MVDIEELIDIIYKEIENSTITEYICEDGTVIKTDVGYVYGWFDEYSEVLKRRYMNEH